ncbi:unnamed protein product [Miscanthus lutarioriparius]|uniref:Uncharacterized protein n=1 Tax=Miscanthus lutarioriparius TaxID=422564 RepID=A0A811RVD0_9POAL|nr:unnamed protein product [Miscanthus lutarioriparius]
MGGGGAHGGTTYKGYTIPHNKRWHTVAGKGLCAVMWTVDWLLHPGAARTAVMVIAATVLTSTIARLGRSNRTFFMLQALGVCVILGMGMMTTLMVMDMGMSFSSNVVEKNLVYVDVPCDL